jgi:hypothetical protein
MRRPALPAFPAALLLAACGGDGPTDPPAGGNPISIEIAPAALLFAGPGERQQLKAWAIDADGRRTEVPADFTTSNPDAVAVGADGLATGGATIGSAQIVATSGGLVSAPALALRATPAAGALLIADSQLVGNPEPVDSFAPFGLGWQERVRVRGPAGSPGQLIIATGGAPIGGRIVAVEASTNGTSLITYELIPLPDLFRDLRIHERIRLTSAPPTFARGALNVGGPARPAIQRNVRAIEREFELGPFACKAEIPPNLVTVPFATDNYSADIDADLELELDWDNGLRAAIVTGTLGAVLSGKPRLTLAVEAKVECKWEWTALYVPIGGPISRFFGWKIPLGLGLELSGKVTENGVGVDFTSRPSVEVVIGARCAGVCVPVLEMSGQAPGSLTPAFPALADAGEINLGASGFIYADMVVGWHFLRRLSIKTFEAKAGIKQEASLATRAAQVADPAYASKVTLAGFAEAGTSPNMAQFWDLLRLSVPQLKKEWPLGAEARSPQGTLTITPGTVSPGDGAQLGEMATFTVALSDVTFRGDYAVDGIEIRWQRTNGTIVTLEPGRPGCTDITASQGQVTFSCQADFLPEHIGTQQFYAFVKTRLFGVPLPVPLEIALDSRASITVGDQAPAATLTSVWLRGPVTTAGVLGPLTCSRGADESVEGPVAALDYSNATTCSAAGTDAETGIAQAANVTATHFYSVTTSNGSVSGAPTSIELRSSITANVSTGGLTLSAEADASGTVEMCFDVRAGAEIGWQLTGNLQTSGDGFAKVRLEGAAGGEQADVPGTGSLERSGRLAEGDYCLWFAYGSGADEELPSESYQSSVRLALTP